MNLDTVLAFLVFFPFLAGLVTLLAGRYCVKKREKAGGIQGQENLRDGIAMAAVSLEFLAATLLLSVCVRAGAGGNGSLGQELFLELPGICGLGLRFTMDGFRAVYGCVAAFMWMMATVFSREYFARLHNRNRYYFFLLWTLGATMGVFLSGDLYTTFVFFEIMSFTSYVWVAQEEKPAALRAASTYLTVAVLGGLVMLMGIFLLYHQLGTLVIGELSVAAAACGDRKMLYIAGACMLFGFGAKAGAFPLHIWLPKAHPVAPAPASALLSGILTKTGIYGILILSCRLFLHDGVWGSVILALGIVTMVMGAVLAIFSIDLKRTLACSSMSQIGFILVGVGMQGLLGEENGLAVQGTFLHMVNHSLIKLVLFLTAGLIYERTHALDLNQIRGFGRKKPLLAGIFLTGALAIGGIPLFGGYISKTLLHESIVEYGGGMAWKAVEYVFLFSGGMTVAYMTKLFVAIFMEKNEDKELQQQYESRKRYMSPATAFALTGSALVLLVWGMLPHRLMDRAAGLARSFMQLEKTGHAVAYFSPGNLKGGAISIAIGAAVYLLFVRRFLMGKKESGRSEYINRWPAWLDLEELLYRPLLLTVLPGIFGGLCGVLDRLLNSARILKGLSTVCGVFCRALDSLGDGLIVALRRTVYRDSPLPRERLEGNGFTEKLGRVLNAFQRFGNHTWHRDHPVQRDYVHLAAVKSEEFKESNRIIQRSLSFGLMLFCIGLALTLFYIIWW